MTDGPLDPNLNLKNVFFQSSLSSREPNLKTYTNRLVAMVDGTRFDLTMAGALFLLYAVRQSRQAERVQQTSELSAALADYSNAASNLTKVFGLYSAAFDGEFFKQGMAPEKSIAGTADLEEKKNADKHLTDENYRQCYMAFSHVTEVIKQYMLAKEAYNKLNTDANKKLLTEMSVTVDPPPDFPFSPGLPTSSSVQYSAFDLSLAAKNGTKTDQAAKDEQKKKIVDFLTAGWEGYTGESNPGFTTNKLHNADDEEVGFVVRYASKRTFSASSGLTMKDGAIDYTNAKNLTILATYYLSTGGTILTASKATEFKETYNNEMNKSNTSTQSVTTFASRSLSKVDSLHSMVDRNMSKLFDNFSTIARGS